MKYVFNPEIPVIAIDGISGAGKGTARSGVAKRLGFHQLDSGALYRAVALQCSILGIPLTHVTRVTNRAKNLDLEFVEAGVLLNGVCVTKELRLQSESASIVSQIPGVREAVMAFQLAMCKEPGLVADGRDMWKVYERQRRLHRFFITAKPEIIARRRAEDLRVLNQKADVKEVAEDLRRRDHSDLTRKVAPLQRHELAMSIDTSYLEPEEVQDIIIARYHADELILAS